MTIMYMMIIAVAVTAIFMTKLRNIRILMRRMISIDIMPIAVVDAVTAIPIHKSIKNPKPTAHNMYMMPVAVVDAVTPTHMTPIPTPPTRMTPTPTTLIRTIVTIPMRTTATAPIPTTFTPTPRPIPRRCPPCRKVSRSVSIFLTT